MQPTNSENVNRPNNIISVHFKDELEDFDFKPLTKGLGLQKHKVAEQSMQRKIKVQPSHKEMPKNEIKHATQAQTVLGHVDTSLKNDPQVANFYTALQSSTCTTLNMGQSANSKHNPDLNKANNVDRAAAWLLDVLIVSLFLVVVIVCFSLFSGIELESIIGSVGAINSTIFFITIFSIFYIFYFTVLDSTETIGKNLFRLKIKSFNKPISITTSFSRSLLTLLFLFMLGVPFYFDLHSRLTNSSVFKDD